MAERANTYTRAVRTRYPMSTGVIGSGKPPFPVPAAFGPSPRRKERESRETPCTGSNGRGSRFAGALLLSLSIATAGTTKRDEANRRRCDRSAGGPERARDQEEVRRADDHLHRRQRRGVEPHARHQARPEVLGSHRHQGEGGPASGRLRRSLLAARAGVLVAFVVDRRGDARRRLAGRFRAVPGRPEACTRLTGQAACAGNHPERHDRREARRDAVVRRLRDPLLPDRSAQEVRLLGPADDLDRTRRHGEEDPGRRAGRATRTSTGSSGRGTPTRASPATRSSGSHRRAAGTSSATAL